MATKAQVTKAAKDILETKWADVQSKLKDADEETVLAALELEKAGNRRGAWLIRLHQRYNRLRNTREKACACSVGTRDRFMAKRGRTTTHHY